jgi:hypothetical protein
LPFFSPEPWVAVLQAPATEMWGSQVMQREALVIEVRAELTVGYARIDRHRAGARVERNHFVHRLQRQQVVTTVRYGVEAVSSAEHFHFVL